MRLKIFLPILSLATPIAFLNGPLEPKEALCQSSISAIGFYVETSGYKAFSHAKRCDSKKVEFLQIGNCWEPGDLLSQRRYCLGESFIELETALMD